MPGAADGFTARQLFDANVDRRPLLLCGGPKRGDASADAAYGLWPWGLCDELRRGDRPVRADEWLRDSEGALPRIDFSRQARPPGSWEDIVWNDFWTVRDARAVQLLNIAGADPAGRPYLEAAAGILEALVAADPAPQARFYRDLALADGRQGLDTPELRAKTADAWERYLAIAPPGDPQRPAIERELRRLRGL
jgi:hypothetical protein